ncbi:MAG: site-specific integrase, partial [Gemmataceae bacterium]|nr:site-specific integrase [Gemmataceae bacterium]
HIEHLLLAKMTGTAPQPATAVWLANLTDPLKSRLIRVGLIAQAQPAPPSLTVKQFVTDYLQLRRTELKPSTYSTLELAAAILLQHIDDNLPLHQFGPQHADRIRLHLTRASCPSTANKRTAILKQIFQAAVERGLIERNPFGHIKGLTVLGDPTRRVFIPAEQVHQLLATIPCPQLRLVVALARFGGLRIPSEVFTLRWSDIDLANNRMLVHAPKTARHRGKQTRIIPIFPELRYYLEQLRATLPAVSPSDLVIPRCTSQTALRTALYQHCRQLGIKPWPKPFQNMRASRATELADHFNPKVCNDWMGHSEQIANQCYRMVTEEHFTQAAGWWTSPPPTQNPTYNPTQNPTQQGAARNGNSVHVETQTSIAQLDTFETPKKTSIVENYLPFPCRSAG